MKAALDDDDRVWRSLSDPTRRRVLDLLADGPQTTGQLVGAFPQLGRTSVMKHLDVLAGCGLVLVRWEGRVRWNHLNPVPIQRVCDRWLTRHVQRRGAALNRLKRVIEQPVTTGRELSGRRPNAKVE